MLGGIFLTFGRQMGILLVRLTRFATGAITTIMKRITTTARVGIITLSGADGLVRMC